MRRHLLALGTALAAAALAFAQPSERGNAPAVVTGPPPANQPPISSLPPEVLKGASRTPWADPPAKLPPSLIPPKAPPASAAPSPAPTEPLAPVPPPQRFDTASLRLKRERGQWQLWAGPTLLKDFGTAEAEAYEALRVLRDLRVNARGSVGGVFEYYLADGQAPGAITRHRQVLPFEPDSLRAEQYNGQWVLRDSRQILYNFGRSESDARQALAVCRQYGFNELGYVGHPAPTLKYLMRDLSPRIPQPGPEPVVPASAKMQASEAPRPPLTLPGLGAVGDRLPLDGRHLDLRRENGEWVLYAGRAPLGHFGHAESEGRAAREALEQFRVNELCRVGSSGFGFFLASGRAPQGSTVGVPSRPLWVDALTVRELNGTWALCEGTRPLAGFGDKADEARTALAAIKHYRFDQVVTAGGNHLGNVFLFVRTRY